MPEEIFYNKLYAIQNEILKMVQDQDVGFYLTGGTALSRCYLNHRYSDDLDFFVNRVSDFKKQVEHVVSAFRQHNLQFETGTTSDSFVRIIIRKDKIDLKIDFVNDVKYHYGGFIAADIFHKIDSWRNILSNKLCAISRFEPKDIADILFISNNFPFSWPEIIEEAKNKDLWVDPLEISRLIKEFPANLFDSLKWIFPAEKKELTEKLNIIHNDIFYGKSNSLCEKR